MDRPLRVLMITSEWPTPEQPDIVPFVVRQVEHVRRAGAEVDVFAFKGARHPLKYAHAWLRLRMHLRKRTYDLIHAQFGQSALLPWPKRHPLVVTYRGCDLLGVKDEKGRDTRSGLMLKRLCQVVARKADAVIVVSSHMKDQLPSGVHAHVIPSGLDFEALTCIPRDRARRQIDLPQDERLALFVGSPHEERKRYWLAQKAMTALNARVSARLILGWDIPHDRVALLMSACDLLLFTSRQEGSPNVVKEALALNLPVVSVAVGDVPVRLKGVEGCELCADEDPETIAAAMERVFARGDRIDGRSAVKELDERLLTDRLLKIYREITSRDLAVVETGGTGRAPAAIH